MPHVGQQIADRRARRTARRRSGRARSGPAASVSSGLRFGAASSSAAGAAPRSRCRCRRGNRSRSAARRRSWSASIVSLLSGASTPTARSPASSAEMRHPARMRLVRQRLPFGQHHQRRQLGAARDDCRPSACRRSAGVSTTSPRPSSRLCVADHARVVPGRLREPDDPAIADRRIGQSVRAAVALRRGAGRIGGRDQHRGERGDADASPG